MRVDSVLALGDAVHERRVELGWSQGELAQRMGVSRRWVNEFENGKGTAQLRLALDALTVLGLVLDAEAAAADE
ncbi:y4mF family transcriptional regulator [Curtobacterium sp. PhB172]|uniref:helix-turn-helix domain-containing protein n=1 Tax=unclassified Curtobacterium TaxID=257496 RepID=UPI000FB63851|nr:MULTISPECIES: helix-turn-helix domain-containing protein [unclassified Curtobacterium]ROQ16759.1 y4mF family transcriptional regulator [Curtobacterium sp. PhB171]ROQ25165.1 y4mF family transcriptional regulator [Curtobacterium sp. PhB170]ROS36616.1 y4mF family transcriptional regulator [Curtobacterium sp. PhB131]ROS70286.1 y4mF family transcriptional regulator [Curtobacterium sp. PhB172]ROS71293.1 y4mF family transcriptional regulator [Curtobacterium sp. PhB141]